MLVSVLDNTSAYFPTYLASQLLVHGTYTNFPTYLASQLFVYLAYTSLPTDLATYLPNLHKLTYFRGYLASLLIILNQYHPPSLLQLARQREQEQ